MTPLSVVQPLEGAYAGEAGVVVSVKKDRSGEVVSAVVEMDTDKKHVEFAAGQLTVLKAH